MGMFQYFKIIIIVQLFFSFAITSITYKIDDISEEPLNYVSLFSGVSDSINMQSVSDSITEGLDRQTKIPLADISTLVFYSGNILIDMMLNFLFAIPQMIGLIITGLTALFGFDHELSILVQLFASVVVSVLYILGIFQLLMNIRSQGSVV